MVHGPTKKPNCRDIGLAQCHGVVAYQFDQSTDRGIVRSIRIPPMETILQLRNYATSEAGLLGVGEGDDGGGRSSGGRGGGGGGDDEL